MRHIGDFADRPHSDTLRIAIIAHLKYPIAEPFSGGLEMHTHLLASKLTERGHKVSLFAPEGSDHSSVQPVCKPTGCLESDPILSRTIDAVEYRAYSDIVASLRARTFDVIHFNALHFLPLEQVSTLGAPMVVVLHTPPFSPLDAAAGSAADCATFVAVSSSLAAGWPMVTPRPLIIENGIDLDRFPFRRPASDDVFAFWSGRIVPEKGLHLAIDAARQAAIPLKIAGLISDPTYWDREIAPRLHNGAVYLGHLEQTALAAYLGRAAVAICTPLWEEPFGLVVAEALACGTPVAGFACGALPDILDMSCGALVAKDDIGGLARAIRQCLGLDRRACRNRAETRFDADLMIDRYEALYHDVIAAREATGPRLTKLLDGAEV